MVIQGMYTVPDSRSIFFVYSANILNMKPFLSVLLVLTLAFNAHSQDIREVIRQKQPAIDSLIRKEMEALRIPGLVVGIGDRDNLVMLEAYGLADVQNGAPVQTNTRFELASITKQFTASAILILEQQGKLSIDDKITKYIDYAPPEWSEITIRHLMTHTSGLPGLYSDGNFNKSAYSGLAYLPKEEMIKYVGNIHITKERLILATKTDKLDFTPGDKFNYSDVGYVTLGIIIDNITGSYHDFLQKEIFDPVGMTSTYLVDQEKIHPLEARGYSLKNDTLINIRRFWQHELPSHYGVFSNVEDLYRWSKALDTEEILTNESKEKLWSVTTLNDGSISDYGLGWDISGIKGSRIVSHTGVTGTSIYKLPDEGLTIIALTNLGFNGNDGVSSSRLSFEIMNLLDIAPKTEIGYVTSDGKTAKPLSKKMVRTLIGEYFVERAGENLMMKEVDGEVRMVIAPFFDNPLALLDDHTFLVLGLSEELILTADKDYKVITSNRGFDMKRVE